MKEIETPWTPGPWEIRAKSPAPYQETVEVVGRDRAFIGFVTRPEATLIAAAPEMAELVAILADEANTAPAADVARALLSRIRGEAWDESLNHREVDAELRHIEAALQYLADASQRELRKQAGLTP